jgi:glycosyltransferase involved in cell wall biosynthesis
MTDGPRAATDDGASADASRPPGRKLDILFLSHYFPPEGNAPAARVHEMCRRWVRDGHRVHVITCAPNHPNGVLFPGYRNLLRRHEVIDGIEVTRVWTYIAANKGTTRRILNYLSYLLSATLAALTMRRPDVLIATSPQFFCGWAGTVVATLRRLPFILEIRDIWPESIEAVGALRARLVIRILETMERAMYRSATHIVTVGEGYRRQLGLRGVDAADITVIPNGIDRELFTAQSQPFDIRGRYGLDGKFICAYIGTIGMASGLGVILRAATILKHKGRDDIAFLLVGDGAVQQDLHRDAQQAGLDNIVFTGRVDRHLVPSILRSVDVCLVHLRRQELFKSVLPSKIFEAAGMARPIILGVEGCAAELLDEAGAGINIQPENEHELVEAVERLAADPALARSFGQSGQQFVTAHYDREVLAQRYMDTLLRLA